MYKGTIDIVREVSKSFYELDEERAIKIDTHGVEIVDNSPLLRVVERWLRMDYKQQLLDSPLAMIDGRPITKWDILKDSMKEYGDKFYNYWN